MTGELTITTEKKLAGGLCLLFLIERTPIKACSLFKSISFCQHYWLCLRLPYKSCTHTVVRDGPLESVGGRGVDFGRCKNYFAP